MRREHVPSAAGWLIVALLAEVIVGAPLTNEELRNALSRCLTETSDVASVTASCADMSKWDTSVVTDMSALFRGASFFNGDISGWDTSAVKIMRNMFQDATSFNQDISRWNTTSVNDMGGMFWRASSFNQPIGGWDTSAVTDMAYMLNHCELFNQDIGDWNTGAVRSMAWMFAGNFAFNQDISRWDVSSVTNALFMFGDCPVFNQNLSRWDTGAMQDISFMFFKARAFNGDISAWDVSRVMAVQRTFAQSAFNQDIGAWRTDAVVDMSLMFEMARQFNQPGLHRWNVSAVSTFQGMFNGAAQFNQDISAWDTRSATDTSYMFAQAIRFNQPIGKWDIASVVDMTYMFQGASDFNQALPTWASSSAATVGMLEGTPKLSLSDVDECAAAASTNLPLCACDTGAPECTNTDGAFQCQCLAFPLQQECEPGQTTLRFSGNEMVACTVLGPACVGARANYTCSSLGDAALSVPGKGCTREFEGLQTLCAGEGPEMLRVVVSGSLGKFQLNATYPLDSSEEAELVRALQLDGAKLSGAEMTVLVEPAGVGQQWLCGGEPAGAYFDIGGRGAAVPWLYLGLSTTLTMAGEAVINVKEAIELRDWVRLGILFLDAAGEVAGGSFLVGGTKQVVVSTGRRVRGCLVRGVYDGREFELVQECGDLQRIQRLGLPVDPLCRETVVLTATSFYVALADVIFSTLVFAFYGGPVLRSIAGWCIGEGKKRPPRSQRGSVSSAEASAELVVSSGAKATRVEEAVGPGVCGGERSLSAAPPCSVVAIHASQDSRLMTNITAAEASQRGASHRGRGQGSMELDSQVQTVPLSLGLARGAGGVPVPGTAVGAAAAAAATRESDSEAPAGWESQRAALQSQVSALQSQLAAMLGPSGSALGRRPS